MRFNEIEPPKVMFVGMFTIYLIGTMRTPRGLVAVVLHLRRPPAPLRPRSGGRASNNPRKEGHPGLGDGDVERHNQNQPWVVYLSIYLYIYYIYICGFNRNGDTTIGIGASSS